jgi:hypothetical protein
MAMRVDCKHFESRTYSNGEAVRSCNLDLAPEAPWRCPASCPKFEVRLADVDWKYGTLVIPPTPPAPESEAIAEVLDAAEDVVNSVGARVLAEVERERQEAEARQRRAGGLLGRLRRRRGA